MPSQRSIAPLANAAPAVPAVRVLAPGRSGLPVVAARAGPNLPSRTCRAEQGWAEPGWAEPSWAEAGWAEPGWAEPGSAEPGWAEDTQCAIECFLMHPDGTWVFKRGRRAAGNDGKEAADLGG
jgi:hypothetical protein